MEMPKGWIRLFAWNDDHQQFCQPWKDTDEALKLLRQMAELLEGFGGRDGHEKVNTILAKFKEWE